MSEIAMPDPSKMQDAEIIAEIRKLQQKRLTQKQPLTLDELRYGVTLLRASRVKRAGSKGGSAEKAKEAKKSFVGTTLDDFI